jgi:hypothetical protein
VARRKVWMRSVYRSGFSKLTPLTSGGQPERRVQISRGNLEVDLILAPCLLSELRCSPLASGSLC